MVDQFRVAWKPDISVVFCSRGRPEALREALQSLWSLAQEPGKLEAIIAIDPDDDSYDEAQLPPGCRLWVAPERFGYRQLHKYLNEVAKQAVGSWSMWFNDDMRMRTTSWDITVKNHRPAILWPHANHVDHANIAPIWPTRWADVNQMVTPTTHMDTFLQRVGERLGRHDRIPVMIEHQRADVTGLHDDQTYAEGRKPLGPEGMVGEFPYDLVNPYAAKIIEEGLL